jgi:hypothetical protein
MPYLDRIARAHETRPDLFPPGKGMYVHLSIQHDHWCPILTQPAKVAEKLAEACECVADITFTLDGKTYSITRAGNVVKTGAVQ